MNREDIKNKIKDIIVDKNDVDAAEVTENANFETDLGMDSLDRVELLMEIEKEYDITIPDDDAEKAITINDCVDLVEKLKK